MAATTSILGDQYTTTRYLLLALAFGMTSDCEGWDFHGHRMARTVNGRLALVPDSVQKGDVIATCFQNLREVRFVFKPVGPEEGRRDIDERISHLSHQHTLGQVRPKDSFFTNHRRLEVSKWLVMHCKFAGILFEDFAYSDAKYDRPDKHNWPYINLRALNCGTLVIH